MRGGSTHDIPAFPKIEERLGYNPARFLHTQSPDGHSPLGDTSELALAEAVIQGIDEIDTIHAWVEVETALGRGPTGEPRQRVSDWLDRRHRQLTGDSAEQLADEEDGTHPSPSDAAVNGTSDDKTPNEETEDPAIQPSPSAPAITTSTDATGASDESDEPLPDPTCATCGEDLTVEEIAGKIGYWCPAESDFREPETTSSPADALEHHELALVADGGTESTSRCPDCRAELTREEIGDEVAYWCSYEGQFKDPQNQETREAVA